MAGNLEQVMSRTPIVLIHGLMGTLNDPSIHAPMNDRAVFAPDLFGYGEFSAAPTTDLSIAAQIAYLHRMIAERYGTGPVHLLGHSMGGAIVSLFAAQYPALVATIANVEGNFTLKDAFWSARLARMSAQEADAILAGQRADPATWLARSGIPANNRTLAVARTWLALQPASTLRAMGADLVEVTSKPEYLETVHRVFERHPIHLVAGERSRGDWDTPDWALAQAKSFTVMPRCGHLMMLEEPDVFGRVVAQLLD
jgi:lipase